MRPAQEQREPVARRSRSAHGTSSRLDDRGTARVASGPRRQAQLRLVAPVLRGAPRPVPRDLHRRDAHRADPRVRHVHDRGCSSSPPATTATSRTRATGSTASRSSCSRSAARWRRRRARCGGPRTTATTTASPTPSATCTRPSAGFWWSHVGWILCDKYNEADTSQIRDFAKYPELRFIDKHDWIGPWTLGVACFLIGGWSGLAHRLLRVDGGALARDVHGQLGRARVRAPRPTRPTTRAATRCSSRSRPAARAGTTTTTATRGRPARDSAGGRSTRPTTCCAALSWVGIVRDLRPVPATVIEEARAAKARRRASGTSPPSRRRASPSTPDDRAAGTRTARARAASRTRRTAPTTDASRSTAREWKPIQSLARDLVADVQQEAVAAGPREVDAAVEHVGSVHEQRTAPADRGRVRARRARDRCRA